MGIAAPPTAVSQSKTPHYLTIQASKSMSQDYHDPAIFTGFSSNGFERSSSSAATSAAHDTDQHHVPHQIRRDKLRVPGFEFDPTMVGMEEEEPVGIPSYHTSGMLSERFSFGASSAAAHGSATELLEQQYVAAGFRAPQSQTAGPTSGDWYGLKDHPSGGAGVNVNAVDSAAAMQLFLMNPQPRSPSTSPRPPPHLQTANSTSSLHMLLPNSSNSLQGFNASTASLGTGAILPPPPPPQFPWVPDGKGHGENPNPSIIPGVAFEGQGLSLSLSTSLQHLEAAKAEEFRLGGGDGGNLLFYNNQVLSGGIVGGVSTEATRHKYPYKNFPAPMMHLQSGMASYGASSLGVVSILRNSKYLRAAQELLEEFCSVGRGQFRKGKQLNRSNSNPSSGGNPGNAAGGGSGGGGGTASSSKEAAAPLSASDRMEHQRRKVKLLSMLDEVDRRYNHYCEQMQMVVNSFDLVMGFGSAVPYTALAQKAMSRHFRCLKDAIAEQLKHSCEILGEKDGAGNCGLTKGETPRLKLLDQSLRQQRAYHQMGMMEQEAWRPQRGLPERSVNILRAWLFEHFLHPYPSDADKHLLARQTGLSRNQVSNWFINARVRLWKPMVEEMYQQEAKDDGDRDLHEDDDHEMNTPTAARASASSQALAAPPPPSSASTANAKVPMAAVVSDDDLSSINRQYYPNHSAAIKLHPIPSFDSSSHVNYGDEACHHGAAVMLDYSTVGSKTVTAAQIPSFGSSSVGNGNSNPGDVGSTLIRFGTTAGDVSLTLGLRHAGNMPEKNSFSVTDFGSC
ncbi:hypothetical protein MLD38_004631 [Melastoma candidum]|uniref:Uncharacterized protein n=1 Tax=Melastoma candidum TaxID=119954 RepID=A0ACB9S7U0_9MYRT|nr:hypothetical protein MLD38_004631 [Melastoma candidum]